MAVGLTSQVKDMNDPIPYRLAVVRFVHRHGLHKCRRAAVLGFNGLLKLVLAYFIRHSWSCQTSAMPMPTPCDREQVR